MTQLRTEQLARCRHCGRTIRLEQAHPAVAARLGADSYWWHPHSNSVWCHPDNDPSLPPDVRHPRADPRPG